MSAFRYVFCLVIVSLLAPCAWAEKSVVQNVVSTPSSDLRKRQPASANLIREWQDKRFGMFVHWGPVSLKGTEIGWSRGREVPSAEYDQLYKQFNPTKFNAVEWVKVAKDAGMKYVVITCKDDKVYLFVMNWPQDGPLVLPAIDGKVLGASMMAGTTVRVEQATEGLRIHVPTNQRNDITTAIELTIEGAAFDIEPVNAG